MGEGRKVLDAIVEHDGKSMTSAEWAKHIGFHAIYRNWGRAIDGPKAQPEPQHDGIKETIIP